MTARRSKVGAKGVRTRAERLTTETRKSGKKTTTRATTRQASVRRTRAVQTAKKAVVRPRARAAETERVEAPPKAKPKSGLPQLPGLDFPHRSRPKPTKARPKPTKARPKLTQRTRTQAKPKPTQRARTQAKPKPTQRARTQAKPKPTRVARTTAPWAKARELAGGTWTGLAKALRLTVSALRGWRAKLEPSNRAKLEKYVERATAKVELEKERAKLKAERDRLRLKKERERERVRLERAKERERVRLERAEERERVRLERLRLRAEEREAKAREREAERQRIADELRARELEQKRVEEEREAERQRDELRKQSEEIERERQRLLELQKERAIDLKRLRVETAKFPYPEPSWKTARDYAGGWQSLANILHVGIDVLRQWVREEPAEAIARRNAFIQQAQKSRIWTDKQVKTFNYLCKLAGDLGFYPQYKTHSGYRKSKRTVRYFWTRALGRAPDMQLLEEILAWYDALEPKQDFHRWHAATLVLEWGADIPLPPGKAGRGYPTLFAGWKDKKTGKGVPKEYQVPSYFLQRTKSDMRAGSREFVRQEIISTFESLAESTNLIVVDWISVANYRPLIEPEIRKLEELERVKRLREAGRRRYEGGFVRARELSERRASSPLVRGSPSTGTSQGRAASGPSPSSGTSQGRLGRGGKR